MKRLSSTLLQSFIDIGRRVIISSSLLLHFHSLQLRRRRISTSTLSSLLLLNYLVHSFRKIILIYFATITIINSTSSNTILAHSASFSFVRNDHYLPRRKSMFAKHTTTINHSNLNYFFTLAKTGRISTKPRLVPYNLHNKKAVARLFDSSLSSTPNFDLSPTTRKPTMNKTEVAAIAKTTPTPKTAVAESDTNEYVVKVPPVSSRILATLDPCVVLMKELIGKYSHLWPRNGTTSGGGIYSLAQGVVYWEPPESSKQALVHAASSLSSSLLHTYCPDEGLPELRDAILCKLSMENNVDNHAVIVTSGANQAYMNCVLTLLDNMSSKAVVFAPYYFNHVMALQMTLNDSSKQLLIGPTNTKTGQPNLQWLEEKFLIHNTNHNKNSNRIRMVTIVNPGNPTGTYLSRQYMQQVVDLCRMYNCWLIIDATYEYFIHSSNRDDDDINDNNMKEYYYDGYFGNDPHVIHISSFSKSYALAGYRCGYVVLHKDAKMMLDTSLTKTTTLFDQMLKVQDTIPICPSRISQIVALGAMKSGRDWVVQQVQTLESSRNVILESLAPLLQQHTRTAEELEEEEAIIMGGSGAMYLMAKLPSPRDNEKQSSGVIDDVEVAEILVRDYGVAVIPGSFCGYPGWIRVCYSNLHPSDCHIAAQRLRNGLTHIVESNR